jgi:hypothetical protein
MLHPVPFKAEHLMRFNLQPTQLGYARFFVEENLRCLEGPHAHTLMDDNEPMMCGGALQLHEQYARMWAYVSADIGPRRFAEGFLLVRRWLDTLPYRRLDATCADTFTQGHRWLRAFGFTREDSAGLTCLELDGGNGALYAKVKT